MSQDPATPYSAVSTGDTNANNVKASTAVLMGWALYNSNVNQRYFKLYNKATAPTVGTDTPLLRVMIPGNTAGAGSNIAMPPNGISFSRGLSYGITANAADNDTAAINANEVVVNLFYQ